MTPEVRFDPNGVYSESGTGFVQAEIERLQAFSFPDRVSVAVVKDLTKGNLGGRAVVDVGCGPNPCFGDFLVSSGANYWGVDLNRGFLTSHRSTQKSIAPDEMPNRLVVGDALDLPFHRVDIGHARFLVENLRPDDRDKAVAELLRVSDRFVLIDYDWSNVEGTGDMRRFLLYSSVILTKKGTNILMGAGLERYVEDIAQDGGISIQTEVLRFSRKDAGSYEEVLPLARSLIKLAQSMGEINLSSTWYPMYARLSKKVKRELSKPESERGVFTPPDIVAVVARKD